MGLSRLLLVRVRLFVWVPDAPLSSSGGWGALIVGGEVLGFFPKGRLVFSFLCPLPIYYSSVSFSYYYPPSLLVARSLFYCRYINSNLPTVAHAGNAFSNVHVCFYERLRLLRNEAIAVTPQSSHSFGSPISQRECAGFN